MLTRTEHERDVCPGATNDQACHKSCHKSWGLVFVLLGAACSGTDSGPAPSSADMVSRAGDMAGSAAGDGGTPSASTTASALVDFVRAGSYKSWKAEPAIHGSTGPHGGNVRTYVNDALYASLKAGNTSHPKGSIVVKELYGGGTSSVTGHAVDVKDDQTGEWVFFEGFAPSYGSPYYYRGTTNFCASCHAPGLDYVLTQPSALP